MRIIDVRKLNRGYVVYVNEDYDIKTLDEDKRFQELTTYYKNHKLLGKEYYFTFVKPEACSKIQTYLRKKILGVAQEKKVVKRIVEHVIELEKLDLVAYTKGKKREERKKLQKILNSIQYICFAILYLKYKN